MQNVSYLEVNLKVNGHFSGKFGLKTKVPIQQYTQPLQAKEKNAI